MVLLVLAVIAIGVAWFAQLHNLDPDKNPPRRAVPFALRGTATVGPDYVVSVRAVNLNANRAIQQANASNPAPKGQYVVVTLSAQYVGMKVSGDPQSDLSVRYSGSDSHFYGPSTCSADLGDAYPSDPPPLSNGSKATYSVCFDLPPDAISGGTISVAERNGLRHQRRWEINN